MQVIPDGSGFESRTPILGILIPTLCCGNDNNNPIWVAISESPPQDLSGFPNPESVQRFGNLFPKRVIHPFFRNFRSSVIEI